jgi:4-hydroxy-tetrahydrodipicolinate synthase
MYLHFRTVARKTSLPLVLYDIPSRTGREIALETMCRLQEMGNIVGLKAASGSTDKVTEVVRRTRLTVLSGDDSMTLPFMAVGGKGVISVAANVAPVEVKALVRRFLDGDAAGALALHLRLFNLFKALFIETNPIPVKAAMHMMGLIGPDMRLPLSPPTEPHRREIERALREYGLVM